MDESVTRMIDKTTIPDENSVRELIGEQNYSYWKKLFSYIVKAYPGTFKTDDWIYGGKKHGWGLRFKKSKSFCTLIPEKNKITVVIVFGRDERDKVENITDSLSEEVLEAYRKATTYHDGKWLSLELNSKIIYDDIIKLLSIKRRP